MLHSMVWLIHHPCWRLVALLPSGTLQCWAMQTNIWILCIAKVKVGKHGTPTPMYKGMKKEFRSTNNVDYKFDVIRAKPKLVE